MVLLVGSPGAGKSTFCHQVVLRNIELRPVIYITTESNPSIVEESLRTKGLGKEALHPLGFIDAFHETMGLPSVVRSDTLVASSEDLTSLSIAISKLQEKMGENVLLIFDSLTSPYLMSGVEILKFVRMTLLRLAAQGHSVLACIDEGCGKLEDLVAMMSISNGVIKMETGEGKQSLNVVKHPTLKPVKIMAPIELEPIGLEERVFNPKALTAFIENARAGGEQAIMRRTVGDFVNLFWPNFAHWSGMLWDPKRFPMMVYEKNKEDGSSMVKIMKKNEEVKRAMFPWRMRLLTKLIMPKSFSKPKDMKKLLKWSEKSFGSFKHERSGNMIYLEDISKMDEHYIRIYESSECWGFENISATMGFYIAPCVAATVQVSESWNRLEREWNAVETKCIGLGDPYCEVKLVPGKIDELKYSLEKDVATIEKIHQRLMHHLMEFLLKGKPLLERPTLGSMVNIHRVCHAMVFPALAGERFQMVLGMGGAKAGKQVGEQLLEAGLSEDEAVERVLNFLNRCKVGKVTMDETIRIVENCENSQTKLFTTKFKGPSCFLTTGFLNGFFSAVKNQHVKETKCIAMGDPYCEWEFR
jgi:predicted hydrocarbon binding protein/archaellum biogenesis ATPase FlaH